MTREFCFLAMMITTAHATAATITVCPSGCNETSVRAAVDAATPGDVIQVSAGVYRESKMYIRKSLTIQGAGMYLTTIDVNHDDRVFSISSSGPSGIVVNLRDLAITGAYNDVNNGNGAGIRILAVTVPISVYISRCRIFGNDSTPYSGGGSGGGIHMAGPQNSLFIEDSIIENNLAADYGGGIYAGDGWIEIRDSTISSNSAKTGGGVYTSDADAVFENVNIASNSAEDDGGGLVFGCHSASLTKYLHLSESRIDGNSAGWYGGGLYFEESCGEENHIRETVFVGNSARAGGAMYLDLPTDVHIENTTVTSNFTTNSDAGGIFARGNSEVKFSTIAFNESHTGYAAGVRNEGEMSVLSSIVSANTGNNCGGVYTSLGYNIDDDTTCGFGSAGDKSGYPAGLLPAVDEGGHYLYHPLESTSIAIDNAATELCPTIDQLGNPRPVDGNTDNQAICDSGAIELDPSATSIFSDGFESNNTSKWSASVP